MCMLLFSHSSNFPVISFSRCIISISVGAQAEVGVRGSLLSLKIGTFIIPWNIPMCYHHYLSAAESGWLLIQPHLIHWWFKLSVASSVCQSMAYEYSLDHPRPSSLYWQPYLPWQPRGVVKNLTASTCPSAKQTSRATSNVCLVALTTTTALSFGSVCFCLNMTEGSRILSTDTLTRYSQIRLN